MHTTDINWENYPNLQKYSAPLKPMTRRLIGRDSLIRSIMAAFSRAELCNVILLAPAGCGKTALVQGTMERDADRLYLEVDLARMIADCQNDTNEMAAKLKMLFSETEQCVDNEGQEIVLFIDEFHQVVQLSAAAVEALKPLLADSGTRGIRVIAATTLEEFNQFIAPNQPLVERLQRINVPEPDEDATVEILKNMAKTYGVDNLFYDDHVFHMIYEYTNRYIPANSQPRKSIKVLDAMVGWHRAENRKMDDRLLADVIQESEDVNVAFRVDASTIKERLDEKVLAQQYATSQIERRLQLCVADLNDKSKPMSTFLFTGSTGVGKTEMTKQLAEILFQDQRRLLRFDMTEYANDDSLERFRDLLTTRIWEHPYSIVLLDEIEKACSAVTRLLLQVLDDGRLTNRNNREVSFTNCYIVLTTNAGSEIYKTIAQYGESNSEKDMEIIAKKYDKLIRRSLSETSGDNRFPPELIGRIDVMVPFQPLSRDTMSNIVKMKLRKLKEQVRARHGVHLVIDKDVIRYLVEDNLSTDSDSGGARIVMSKLETEVTTNVARYINEHPFASRIAVKVDGDMAIDNKRQLESRASIKVLAC
jgi:ATP-dependent Clp protease ATP-binding subunit ClpA